MEAAMEAVASGEEREMVAHGAAVLVVAAAMGATVAAMAAVRVVVPSVEAAQTAAARLAALGAECNEEGRSRCSQCPGHNYAHTGRANTRMRQEYGLRIPNST